VSFEWALIAGKNDDEATAHKLGKLLRRVMCHVNLIPLNPTGGYAGQSDGLAGRRGRVRRRLLASLR
jgi:23S rRNA (adenine2503-C2)-methyltransferase